jgi:group I intron endonuclease
MPDQSISPQHSQSGIYHIFNRRTGKSYVGSAVNLSRRERVHFRRLRGNSHPNQYLQNAFNIDGEYFEFVVIEFVSLEHLIDREQYWIDTLQSHWEKTGYNIAPFAGRSSVGRIVSQETRKKLAALWRGRKHTEEAKRKVAEAQRGRSPSEETRRKLSLAMMGNHCAVGPRSDEIRKKMSQIQQQNRPRGSDHHYFGDKAPESLKQRCRELAKSNIGTKASEQTRAKMRESQRVRRAMERG